MTRKLPPVDVVLVGFGWTGAILAQELTQDGLQVLAIERGAWRDTPSHFPTTVAQDELRWYWRKEMFQSTARETLTFRNSRGETALPMRRWGSFLPGEGVGGGGVHWNGQTWRFLPSDFVAASHNAGRYGPLGPEMTVQDYGVTYDELEPHYDRFEKLCGIGGRAGNLNGEIRAGGNPFEGPRSAEYPNPPMHMTFAQHRFEAATGELGLKPFPGPSANMSQPYVNPLGCQLAPCTYCGFCEKYGCGNYSKASAQTTILPVLMRKPNFSVKTHNEVLQVKLDSTGRRATGVIHVDQNGEEYEQPADLVILCAYQLSNTRLMMLSGIGEIYDPATGDGLVGKNYCYQVMSGADVFFDDKYTNEFVGAGALGMCVDDYNGDNFDHSGLGFIGGGYIACWTTHSRPIERQRTPEGTPTWGSAWKKAVAENFLKSTNVGAHGASMAHAGNHLDLDPTYTDVYGRPLMRMTFDFTANDRAMSVFLTERVREIAERMGGREIRLNPREGPYDSMPYQTTHNTGGTIMGTNPSNSVVNRYLQSWDVPNLFVMGAGVFPQNAGYNPTGTVAALAYWSADAIRARYLRNPGPLVQA
ncbi:GMC family oxidoreductase [Kumtagia ephedrae]|jgi:gluconate 2-dehydrogenase alpha chain|uniref:GMC family oxidoreductase n=1 Tax=Kumtagia ephedrae TaxID=2116701 RepID=A0A2P7S8X2_9HYPH|nr:GMC family oxidoreductase [Mesorhizobium ephedrae]PSJ58765.1 GMC family oxidoreductase [Mesorhizobium ephedrae]